MEEYIVSARKYRPTSFDSVVGQGALTTTLKNAVKSGKLAHAYLFCGPRGVGKTTCARIFAKAINCEHPLDNGEACDHCESCKAFNEQRSYTIFELDAASNNSVENIKTLMEQTRIPPQVGRYKVFIIDEVHMLSAAAFNAFLKTLEEPPAHVIFILATTEKHKIPPTILSRCQIYDFERMTVLDTILHLKKVAEKEGLKYEEEALAIIAEKADGGMRDALSIFDQVVGYCQGDITYAKVIEDLNVLDTENYFRIIDMAIDNKVADMMVLLDQLLAKGFDGFNFMVGLAAHTRNVMMAKDAKTLPLLEVSDEQRRKFEQQARKAPTPFLYRTLKIMNDCEVNYRQSSNKRLLIELTLIRIAQITQPDEDVPGAGRSPYRLKSLFKLLASTLPKPALQVAGVERPKPEPVARVTGAANNATTIVDKEDKVFPANTSQVPPTVGKRKLFGDTFSHILHPTEDSSTSINEEKELTEDSSMGKRAFTQDELEMAWGRMCNRMPKEMMGLAARMRNMTVHVTQHPEIEIILDNNTLLDQVQDIKNRIRATLAKDLKNKDIKIQVRLAKPEEMKKVLTKREVYEDMLKKSPAIEKLRATLELTMA